MRLTLKITMAILLGVVLLFSLHSYLSIQRERTQLKERLSREALHLGQSLRVMLDDIWKIGGEGAALSFLERSNLVSGSLPCAGSGLTGQRRCATAPVSRWKSSPRSRTRSPSRCWPSRVPAMIF